MKQSVQKTISAPSVSGFYGAVHASEAAKMN